MYINCDEQEIAPDDVNEAPAGDLHEFKWAENVGSLPATWNNMVGYYDIYQPNAVHFTDGGPWLKDSRINHMQTNGEQYLKKQDDQFSFLEHRRAQEAAHHKRLSNEEFDPISSILTVEVNTTELCNQNVSFARDTTQKFSLIGIYI